MQNKLTYRAYILVLLFSVTSLLRYVDFFHWEEYIFEPQQDLIELDVSTELSDLGPEGQISIDEWVSSIRPLWKYQHFTESQHILSSNLRYRWTLFEGVIYRSNPVINLPQIYTRQTEA